MTETNLNNDFYYTQPKVKTVQHYTLGYTLCSVELTKKNRVEI